MSFFDKQFRKEDLFLYIVTLAIIIFFCWQHIESKSIIRDTVLLDADRVDKKDAYLFELAKLKYDFANKRLLTNTITNSIIVLIAIVVCMTGVLLIVRQVRDNIEVRLSLKEGASGNVTTTLPGITLVFLGVLIIIFVLTLKDKYEIQDGDYKIEMPVQDAKKKSSADTSEILPGV